MRALYPAAAVRRAVDAPARAGGGPPPFGLEWLTKFLPHYMTAAPSQLHRDMAADLREIQTRRGQHIVTVAPRESGKTAILSKGYVLNGSLEGIEPLTLLLAETGKQAKAYLAAVKRELERNPLIRAAYPDAAGKGDLWQAMHVRLRNGCEIMAAGSGGRVLGTTSGERRPTLVIVDDGNERGDAHSPTKRDRKLEWVTKDLLPVGEPGTNFVVAGTPIHREAIVCHLRSIGWRTRSYRSLLREPANADLWDEYAKLLLNLSDPHREATAAAFFAANRPAMEAGAELLWPGRKTLLDLMQYRIRYGERAYRSEYTDDPGAPEGAEWPSEYFDPPAVGGRLRWFDRWPDDLLLKVIALDPSKGADARAGDYQARAELGLGRDGTIHVDCDLRHETPEAMCARVVAAAKEFGRVGRPVDEVILEDNGTMGLIRVAMELATGSQLLRWRCLTQTDPKPLRIRAVAPYLSRGQVKVRNTPGGRKLVEQWRDFPFGSHDDGPDAVATGVTRLEQLSAMLG